MSGHAHALPPGERPRVPRVAPPLTRQRVAAIRAAAPLPARPPRERAEPLHKGSTPVYDVHGLAHDSVPKLCWSPSGAAGAPFRLGVKTPHLLLPSGARKTHQQKVEPSRLDLGPWIPVWMIRPWVRPAKRQLAEEG